MQPMYEGLSEIDASISPVDKNVTPQCYKEIVNFLNISYLERKDEANRCW